MTIRSNEKPLIIIMTIALGSLSGPATLAQSNGCYEMQSGNESLWRVGTPDIDSEKDTIGFICSDIDVATTSSLTSPVRAGREAVQVGVATGDGEKDTIGYVQRREGP